MAAYYGARSVGYDWRSPSMTREARSAFEQRVGRAMRLADHASDRERLIIRTWWARNFFAPELRALSETLAVRYPQEVEGHLDLGLSLLQDGRVVEGIPHLERVVALDSLALRSSASGCSACEAIRWMVDGNALMDSLDAAERAGRRWLRLQPRSALAHWRLADVLDQRGRFAAADTVLAAGSALAVSGEELGPLVKHWLRAGWLDRADSLVRVRLEAPAPNGGGAVRLYQTLVLRQQGRLSDALAAAQTLRAASREQSQGGAAPFSAIPHAQVLFEMGRYRAAVALFDSIARWRPSGQPPSVAAMNRSLVLSQSATALAALGDTGRLATLAADVERVGATTSLARSHVQHHYVRGLLLAARGLDAQATDAFRSALSVSKSDDSRTNYELAKSLLRRGQSREAIVTLEQGVRGTLLETGNFRVTLAEVHELLARAWEAAGRPDSAMRHLRYVTEAWRAADAPLASRGVDARRALERLTSR
jgi:tetratricopeptide (TPR) repeat protein